jgi:hypothetical protein
MGEIYDVRVTAYLVDDNNYVTMVSDCHSWIRPRSNMHDRKLPFTEKNGDNVEKVVFGRTMA